MFNNLFILQFLFIVFIPLGIFMGFYFFVERYAEKKAFEYRFKKNKLAVHVSLIMLVGVILSSSFSFVFFNIM